MSDVAIHLRGLSKQYLIPQGAPRADTLREAAAGLFRRSRQGKTPFWALQDVSFEVRRGEVVGVIGRNGAGKSTLLKILSQITEPTRGRAEIFGRVGSLLEVGTGFHPELSGRENIYLNGAILGMRRAEITRHFEAIVAFAEIAPFLDTPVKHYSSGMYVRLAFAVAAHLQPEILLVDEVLAVGDAVFQRKCLGKMGDVAREGRTVLFVSHNMGAVSSLCGRVVHLAEGQVRQIGPTRAVVSQYLAQAAPVAANDLSQLRSPGFGGVMRFRSVQLLAADGATLPVGEPLRYRLVVWSGADVADLTIGASLFHASGRCIGSLLPQHPFAIRAGQTVTLRLTIDNLNLAPGFYYAGFSVGQGGAHDERFDYDIVAGTMLGFQIIPTQPAAGPPLAWNGGWGDIMFRQTHLDIEAIAQKP
ncbi:MAG: ABC transporter ATP-binding protein [Anaerolineales bacterium]|nr:ABC transporter ATP-binding protein [Anaerolineales bacterium]MCB8950871.1 ABC transporter ATP-binding protein [Ardenticatenales bacterium]